MKGTFVRDTPQNIGPELLDVAQRFLRASEAQQPFDAETFAGWRRFHRECDRLIRCFARVYVRRGDDLDDCAQEVWLKLVDQLPGFAYDPARGAFSSWLYRVVRDTTVSYFRHEHRFRGTEPIDSLHPPSDEHSEPDGALTRRESHGEAARMLLMIRRTVSRANYDLLRMRWMRGCTVAETAEALGLTQQQVWYREHRARKKLRAVFAESVG